MKAVQKNIRPGKEPPQVKKLLLLEEFRAERIISLIRLLIFGYFTAINIIDVAAHQADFLTTVVPIGAVAIVAIIFLVHNLVAGRRILKTGAYSEILKYLQIAVDIAIIAYVLHYGSMVLSDAWPGLDVMYAGILYTAFFVTAATMYLIVNSFRFHLYSTIFTGVILGAVYALVGLTVPQVKLLLEDAERLSAVAFFIVIFLSFYLLDVLFIVILTARIRRVLVKNVLQERLARYLPEQAVREVMVSGKDIAGRGEKQRVTVMFADIRGFTAIAEKLSPEEVVDFLNTYFNDMISVIFKHNGVVDKLVGDAIMALFGIPGASDAGPENAVRAAIDMCRKLESLNDLRKLRQEPAIKIGIGIHTGNVVMGSIGNEQRMDYTAIGDTVNIASRLEKLTKSVGAPIVISETTAVRLGAGFGLKAFGRAALRGKTQSLVLHKLDPFGQKK